MIDFAAGRMKGSVQRRHFSGLTLVFLGQIGCGAKSPPSAVPKSGTRSLPRTLFIIGDSTAAIFPGSDARVGWGAVLAAELAGVHVNDAARSGRSSKSYFDEGHFRDVE